MSALSSLISSGSIFVSSLDIEFWEMNGGTKIADLNLSVRARKCMARLNINTIGELMRRSPDDLLGVRNFGVTSLNEIRQRLTEFGMQLRND